MKRHRSAHFGAEPIYDPLVKASHRGFWARFCVLAAAASAVVSVSDGVAQAEPPDGLSCRDHQWGVQGNERVAGQSDTFQLGIRAVRADVYVSGTEYCNHVSSLTMVDSTRDGFYEFGWVIGYSSCNNTYYATARLFIVWKNVGEINDHCRVLASTATSGTFRGMRAGDVDGDRTFSAYFATNLVANSEVGLNWTKGYTIVNSERSNQNDTAYADFTGLEEHESGAWSSFDNVREEFDNDPGFTWVRVAGNHAQVVAG